MTNSLTVVIPAYNEAESLPLFLPQLLAHCEQRGWQVIVVDDGSTDGTGRALAEFQTQSLRVLRHKVNRGYGGALKTGIGRAETDYVATMDADGQHRLDDVEALLQAMEAANADLVIGRRVYAVRSGNRYRELGKWLIRRITGLLLPLHIDDLNSGLKLYDTRLVQQYLHLCPDSMAFSDVITLVFISQRYLVIECPVQVNERLGGKSTISTRTAFETIFEILNIMMMFNPMRIFVPAALFCILIGVLWGLPFVLMGRGVSVASMLAIVSGVLFLFLGLVAQQLSLIRKENTALFIKSNRNQQDPPV